MRLTKREVELSNASEQGKKDFDKNNTFDDSQYGEDKGLKAAYAQGWEIEKKDYHSFYGTGYE